MNKIFVYSLVLGNLVKTTRKEPPAASDMYKRQKQNGSRLVTTNYVIAELIALLSKSRNRRLTRWTNSSARSEATFPIGRIIITNISAKIRCVRCAVKTNEKNFR